MHHPQVCKGFPSAREGLLVNARFVLGQFEKLDGASGHKALKFLETDFGRALAKEVRSQGGTQWILAHLCKPRAASSCGCRMHVCPLHFQPPKQHVCLAFNLRSAAGQGLQVCGPAEGQWRHRHPRRGGGAGAGCCCQR